MVNRVASDFPLPPGLEGFFSWDRVHCPRPLALLDHELLVQPTATGISRAIGEMGSSIIPECHLINYYSYLTSVPRPLQLGDTEERRRARYEQNVAMLLPKIGEKWEKEWLPSILPQLERSRQTDYSGYNDQELLGRLDEMREEFIHRWWVHGMVFYSFTTANVFCDFYKEHVSEDSLMEGYEALQGFETKATDSSRGLWELSRQARANPELASLFESETPENLPEQLKHSEAGRALLTRLGAYLEDYGWRTDSFFELLQPAWWETPAIPLGVIKGHMSIDDEAGPDGKLQAAIRRREELLDQARCKLANQPEKLETFNSLYDAAKSFISIVEDHNHWIDQMGNLVMRYPVLEIGRRLVERGILHKIDEVVMLHMRELREAMRGKDFEAVAMLRAAERARFASVVPPAVIGTPPKPSGDPIEEVFNRFFGQPVEPSTEMSVLTGIAASPGVVTGTAKVVKSLDEAGTLQQGDVMVCEMTLPPWTPLFGTVAAVVADTGGILSHCAIVAREYGIPCVVGTVDGTERIKNGMKVIVDGSKGIVRIES